MCKLLGSLAFLFTLATTPALAVDAFYLGGQVGHVASPVDVYSNAIGFGIDLGVRTNPLLDLVVQLQKSSHSGGTGLGVTSGVLSADFHFWEFNDFEFSLGGGPGFYFIGDTTTQSHFGLHVGSNVDVVVDDSVRVGLGLRYHGVFNSAASRTYWTAMMRIGYLFPGK